MIIDESYQDQISTITHLAPTEAADDNIAIFTATYPCFVRLRSVSWCGRASTTANTSTSVFFALIVNRAGETLENVGTPSVASGNTKAFYNKPERIVFQHCTTRMKCQSSPTTGPELGGRWDGDGRAIALQVGDSIWWGTTSDDSADTQAYFLTLWDIWR